MRTSSPAILYKPVLVGDPSGPVAGEVVLERLGLADAFVAGALDVDQQGVDSLEDFAILGLRPEVVCSCRRPGLLSG